MVFYVLLAIFPGITTLVSLYALFADPATIHDHLAFAAVMMPSDSFNLLQGEVLRIASKGQASLGLASVVGLLFALWSANAGTKAIFDALNVGFDEVEKRSFVRLNLLSLAFTVGAVIALLVAVAAVVVVPLVLGSLGLQTVGEKLISILRWPVLFALVAMGLSFLYRFGPSPRPAKWHWFTVGSVCASFLWLIGSALFSWYLTNFADYTATYGTLGAAIGLMMWLWLSFVVILVGAKLDAEIAHQLQGKITGPAEPEVTTTSSKSGTPRSSEAAE